jgi:hypothetical protein
MIDRKLRNLLHKKSERIHIVEGYQHPDKYRDGDLLIQKDDNGIFLKVKYRGSFWKVPLEREG